MRPGGTASPCTSIQWTIALQTPLPGQAESPSPFPSPSLVPIVTHAAPITGPIIRMEYPAQLCGTDEAPFVAVRRARVASGERDRSTIAARAYPDRWNNVGTA